MSLKQRIRRLEQDDFFDVPEPEPCVIVSVDDYEIAIPVSLLPIIERIYGGAETPIEAYQELSRVRN